MMISIAVVSTAVCNKELLCCCGCLRDSVKVTEKVMDDPNVSFLLSQLTTSCEEVVSKELLQKVVYQWLNVHGFSFVAFNEDYRYAQQVLLKSERALHNELMKE